MAECCFKTRYFIGIQNSEENQTDPSHDSNITRKYRTKFKLTNQMALILMDFHLIMLTNL